MLLRGVLLAGVLVGIAACTTPNNTPVTPEKTVTVAPIASIDPETGEITYATSSASTGIDISDEQDFDAVAGRESIESDAARLESNREKYVLITPTSLPKREDDQPNIVAYALQTNNPVGVKLYSRLGFFSQARSERVCAGYPSSDAAQRAYLSRRGPTIDFYGLDPDGDGYACDWDPTPFRLAVQN